MVFWLNARILPYTLSSQLVEVEGRGSTLCLRYAISNPLPNEITPERRNYLYQCWLESIFDVISRWNGDCKIIVHPNGTIHSD